MMGLRAKGSESCFLIILKIMWGPKNASLSAFPENSRSCSLCPDFIVSIHGSFPHYFVPSIQSKFALHVHFSSKHGAPLKFSKDVLHRQREKVKMSLYFSSSFFISI